MRRLAWGRIAPFLELRDRVAYLERQVEEEREARRRADMLMAQLERFSKQLIYCLTKPQPSDVQLRTGVQR